MTCVRSSRAELWACGIPADGLGQGCIYGDYSTLTVTTRRGKNPVAFVDLGRSSSPWLGFLYLMQMRRLQGDKVLGRGLLNRRCQAT